MTTEQIINELEGLVQFLTCPSYIKDALALIKELQAHNENLKKENKYLRERLAEEAEIKEDMKAEGEWVLKDLNNKLYESKKAPHCSVCNYMSFIRHDYCPNCGAKMKGE